jgi:nitrite reductase/ring-hydroxylating ferredoxin subunit
MTSSVDRSRGAGCSACDARAVRSFPVLDRRELLSRTALAALGIVLAACGGGSDGPTSPSAVSALTLKLSDYPALAMVGGVAYVSSDGTPIAVVRTDTSLFAAFSRVCPHQGGMVAATGGQFNCPVHGARFNLTTGAWIGGQRTSSLRSYAAVYDATAGTVTLGG